jgi:hypothetical protein
MTGLWLGYFLAAYTAPPVNYASGPIVAVIVGLLCLSVVLALLFSSPLAIRLTRRHENGPTHPPDATDAAEGDGASPWSTNAPGPH